MNFQDLLNNISAEQTHGLCKRKFSTGFLSIDQSTALINKATFGYFENYAEKHEFTQKFQDLKSGVRLNNTENRAVTHFKYREPESDLYSKSLDEMEVLTKLIKTNFKKIIIFGIGGSYLLEVHTWDQSLCTMFFQTIKSKLILLQAVTQQSLKSLKI